MNRFVMKRRPDALFYEDIGPGEYMQLQSKAHGHHTWVIWGCPVCSMLLSILRVHHTVNYNGDVNPGICCPSKNVPLIE